MVKLYCPKCMDVYTPKSSRHHHTDGAYFGTGFPHMLFMVHPEYRPKKPTNQFVPRLYGFKIHPLAYQIQQQGASNFKVPMRTVSYNNGRKWKKLTPSARNLVSRCDVLLLLLLDTIFFRIFLRDRSSAFFFFSFYEPFFFFTSSIKTARCTTDGNIFSVIRKNVWKCCLKGEKTMSTWCLKTY